MVSITITEQIRPLEAYPGSGSAAWPSTWPTVQTTYYIPAHSIRHW